LRGWVVFVAAFTAVWWAWAGYTLYANRFDTDDVVFRLVKFAAMAAVVGCSVHLPHSSDSLLRTEVPTSFVLCYVAVQVLLVGLYLRTWRHAPEARGLSGVYLAGLGLGAACWAAALALPPDRRALLVVAGVAASMLAPLVGTRAGTSVPLHVEHLPERFGLLVILVLGETIISVGKGLRETCWTTPATVSAVAGFVVAAGLWWTYFDLAGSVAKHGMHEAAEAVDDVDAAQAEGGRPDGAPRASADSGISTRFDGYVYGHIPATLGLVAVGVGVDHAITESSKETLTTGTAVALCGGAALFFLAMALTQASSTRRLSQGWPWPAAGGLLLGAVLAAGLVLPPAGTAVLAAVAVLVTVVAGVAKDVRGDLPTRDLM